MRILLLSAGIASLGIVAIFACDERPSSYVGPPACYGPPLPPDGSAPLVPPDPHGPPSNGVRAVFAISKLYIGGSSRDGTRSPNAWASYGRDIDGRVTTKDSKVVCRLARGADPSNHASACSGTDNSFGRNILPFLLTTLGQDEELSTNDSIGRGETTNLIVIEGLGTDGTAGTQSPLRMMLLVGASRASDGVTWNVRRDSLVSDDASMARFAFDGAYLADGTLVAAPPSGDGLLWFGAGWGSEPLVLDATSVEFVATLAADGTMLHDGTLSGIVPVAPFLAVARRITGHFSSSLCQGSAFESLAQQLRQAADILVDGTQDPNRDCDGISFGIGFDATLATLGPVVDLPPLLDPCAPDGGAPDAASDSRDADAD